MMSEVLQTHETVPCTETVAEEQFASMIANPSTQAVERFDVLIDDDTLKWYKHETPSKQLRRYLQSQPYGYFEELLAAMHDTEEAFSDYLLVAFRNDPMLTFKNQRAFQSFIKPDDKVAIQDRAMRHPMVMREHFNEIVDSAKIPVNISDYAEQAIYSHGHYMDQRQFIRAVAEAKDMPFTDRKEIVGEIVRGSYFWQDFSIHSALSVESDRKNDCLTALDCMQDFINDGLTTPELIDASLARMADPVQTSIYNDPWTEQVKQNAREAKLLLTLEGILPVPDNQTKQDYADRFVRDELASPEPDLFEIAILTHSGITAETETRRQLHQYDQQHHTTREEDFDRYLARFDGQSSDSMSAEHRHKNDELINAWHEKYIVNEVPIRDIPKHTYWRTVLGYEGSQLNKIIDLVEKYHAQPNTEFSLGHKKFATYQAFFTGQEDRLRSLISQKMEEADSIEIPLDDWQSFAEFMHFSKEQIQQMGREEIHNNWSPGNAVARVEDILDHDEPLFTPKECAVLLRNRYQNSEIDDYDRDRLMELCRHYLGRTITEEIIVPIMDERALALLPNAKHEQTQALIAKTDYYDIYKNASKLNEFADLLSQEQLAELINSVMNLSDEHLADRLSLVWWYMTDQQQESALARLYKNPALAAIEAEAGQLQYFASKKRHTRELTAAPATDLLQALAPKAYATYIRRLHSKTLPYEIQISRPPEANLMPAALENGRQNILFNYAYFYDLCNRVRTMDGIAGTMPKIRGKNTEKNELQALETLTLLHEAGGYTSAKVFAEVDRKDLQRQAVSSVLHNYGLTDDAVNNLVTKLESTDVNLTKFGMWLHTSSRSDKLQAYLSDFLTFFATDGQSISDWKLRHPKGNNLPNSVEPSIAALWVEDSHEQLAINGLGPVRIRYTNDLDTIVQCGARPINNCLHYGSGLNQHALAGLLNADAKLVSVENANGNPVANAVIRIGVTPAADRPVVILEPLYTSENGTTKNELHRTVLASAEKYARNMGLELQIADVKHFGRDIYLATVAMWADTESKRGEVFIEESKAPFTYTDTSGAKAKRTHMFTVARKSSTKAIGSLVVA